ncbi:hypothetical protein BGX26_007322, partial [Mortierella sp. AD094]
MKISLASTLLLLLESIRLATAAPIDGSNPPEKQDKFQYFMLIVVVGIFCMKGPALIYKACITPELEHRKKIL